MAQKRKNQGESGVKVSDGKRQKFPEGEKPFKCSVCLRNYKTKRTLNTHIQKMHVDMKFTCEECDFQFDTVKEYNTHYKTIHEGKELKVKKFIF